MSKRKILPTDTPQPYQLKRDEKKRINKLAFEMSRQFYTPYDNERDKLYAQFKLLRAQGIAFEVIEEGVTGPEILAARKLLARTKALENLRLCFLGL